MYPPEDDSRESRALQHWKTTLLNVPWVLHFGEDHVPLTVGAIDEEAL